MTPAAPPALRWRALVWAALLMLFYALPWLRWNGRQALLFDLPARRFDLFGLTLWPQDVGVLFGLVAVLACTLVLLTTVAGRVWCGHACPQTLWSGLFRWIERSATRRLRPPALARVVKHLAWAAVALWTGITFVGLFSPVQPLVVGFWPARWSGWETFWVLFYATAAWANAGFLREQVCIDLCPYARVAPMLCDADTPKVCYDARRAEPRGARQRGQGSVQQRGRGLLDPTSASDYAFRAAHPALAGPPPRFADDRLGDCLDCGACVQVCPMQLDVRAGPQPECIACGACVDACDAQMRAWRFPTGLVQLASENEMQGRPRRWLRPRTLAALLSLAALLGIGLHYL
ncbi:4Fe-4S dicluster domain-containing protein [Stenotrophomonas sp. CFBP8994]|uniref:4Fe-4S dicluster domain-containing protein n=1 Tax=Stenotrophomonas sp. CFBP8994 TaxID=3096527 RepID=UPI002A6A3D6F|nr:4Fe-4S dicluster domain-containing protein [Stenotrophomonas sp. CFBP8994]MDY0982135.1 4Fe-4S dicluster domain-containing protein [Stenotrophomonas sp. CFBP8994]